MLDDGPPRKGRFFKKNKKMMEKITIDRFDFEEISLPGAVPDNPNANIIHARYHEEEDLAATILNATKFQQHLQSPASRAPILQPEDFYDDWIQAKQNARAKRRSLFDEETNADSEDDSENEGVSTTSTGSYLKTEVEPTSVPKQTTVNPTPEDEFFFDESSIQEKAEEVSSIDASRKLTSTPQIPGGGALKITSSDSITEDASEGAFITFDDDIPPEPQLEESAPPREIPLDPSSKHDQFVKEPQTQSLKTEVETVDPEALDRAFDAAKKAGFEEGFRSGEERAYLQGKQNSQKMFEILKDLIEEFENLKSHILENVQENFHEVCQAVCEALLEKQLEINPKALTKIIKRAIKENMEPSKFTIRLNPETIETLGQSVVKTLGGKVVPDPDLEPADFKIDSEMSTVDGRLKTIVSSLLDSADLSLFESVDLTTKTSA